MKKLIIMSSLILASFLLKAQVRRSGIKVLAKDKSTDLSFKNDSLLIITDDSLKTKMLSDTSGYVYVELPPGKHSIGVGYIGYQTQTMHGINVGEQKTSYVTLMLDNGKEEKPKRKKGGVRLKMKK